MIKKLKDLYTMLVAMFFIASFSTLFTTLTYFVLAKGFSLWLALLFVFIIYPLVVVFIYTTFWVFSLKSD
jgi:hypothetical protein